MLFIAYRPDHSSTFHLHKILLQNAQDTESLKYENTHINQELYDGQLVYKHAIIICLLPVIYHLLYLIVIIFFQFFGDVDHQPRSMLKADTLNSTRDYKLLVILWRWCLIFFVNKICCF